MTFGQQLKLTMLLAVPAILAQFSSVLMLYIDTAMVGHLGANPSASIGLVTTSTWILGGFTMAIASGFAVQVAHMCGAKNYEGARRVLRQGLSSIFILSLVFGLVGVAISPFLPAWLGGGEAINADASAYFRIYAAFVPIGAVGYGANAMLQGSGNMKVPSILYVSMCSLDVVLNYLFDHGAKANVRNARDLGGWKTKDGKEMVKYRMIYRGGRLQPSTLTSKRGKEDLKAQGILAQLDLRGKSDVLSGPTVDYMDFCAPVIEEGYTQMLRDDGAKVKQCFEYVAACVKNSKPVYYHCSLGRDRTGTLSMLLLGVLGVDEGDISKEYELTQFAPYEWATSGGETTKMTRRADYKGAANYIWNNFVGEGESFAQGVEKYLLSIGVQQAVIDEFRSQMLVSVN